MNGITPIRLPDRPDMRGGRVVELLAHPGGWVDAGQDVLVVQIHERTLRFRSPRTGNLMMVIPVASQPKPGELLFTVQEYGTQSQKTTPGAGTKETQANTAPGTSGATTRSGASFWRAGLRGFGWLSLGVMLSFLYVWMTDGDSPIGGWMWDGEADAVRLPEAAREWFWPGEPQAPARDHAAPAQQTSGVDVPIAPAECTRSNSDCAPQLHALCRSGSDAAFATLQCVALSSSFSEGRWIPAAESECAAAVGDNDRAITSFSRVSGLDTPGLVHTGRPAAACLQTCVRDASEANGLCLGLG